MAEPMANIDIEDVLSSIRRLVSEEPKRRSTEAAPQPPLILTPALRVLPDPEPEDETVADAEIVADSETIEDEDAADELIPSDFLDVESDEEAEEDALAGPVEAALASARWARDDEGEVEEAIEDGDDEDLPEAVPGALMLKTRVSEDAMDAELAEPEPIMTPTPAKALSDEQGGMSLEERIADLEAAIGRSQEEFEPDGSEELEELRPHAMPFRMRLADVRLAEVQDVAPEDESEEAAAANADPFALPPEVEPAGFAEPGPAEFTPRDAVAERAAVEDEVEPESAAAPEPLMTLIAETEPEAVEDEGNEVALEAVDLAAGEVDTSVFDLHEAVEEAEVADAFDADADADADASAADASDAAEAGFDDVEPEAEAVDLDAAEADEGDDASAEEVEAGFEPKVDAEPEPEMEPEPEPMPEMRFTRHERAAADEGVFAHIHRERAAERDLSAMLAEAMSMPGAEPEVRDLPEAPVQDDRYEHEAGMAGASEVFEEDDEQIEEALIDEDSLREIVADLVRQELRGELGERITRNVRRMIRRELHRALALQELEGDD